MFKRKRQFPGPSCWCVFSIGAILLTFTVLTLGQKLSTGEIQVQKCWEYKLGGTAAATLASDGTLIFDVTDSSIIEAVAIDTGKRVWSSDVGGAIAPNMVVSGGMVYFIRQAVAGKADLRAVSSETGITKWDADMAVGASSLFGFEDELIVANTDGEVASYSPADGKKLWDRAFTGAVTATAFSKGKALLVSDGTQISSFLDGTDDPIKLVKSDYPVSSLAFVRGNMMTFGDDHGNLTLFQLDPPKINWTFKSGARISGIVDIDGKIIAASDDDFAYALSKGSGTRTWKRRLSGRIQSIRAVNDDVMVVQTVDENELTLLNTENGKASGHVLFKEGEIPMVILPTGSSRFAVVTVNTLRLFAVNGCVGK